MKRTLVIAVATFLLLITLVIGALYWALQGQYASVVINRVSEKFALPITVYEAQFELPNRISLTGVEISGLQDAPLIVNKIELWLTPSSLFSTTPAVESLLVDGLSLQQGIPDLPSNFGVKLKQLAIKNLDYSHGEIIGRDISFQVDNPSFKENRLPIPYGNIQFSAGQIYWRGEAFDSLLIDADYKPKDSTIYGISFDWRQGKFSGQAEEYDNGWSLVNFTVENLRLNQDQWQKLDQLGLNDLSSQIASINSLDILKSTVESPKLSLTNFDLSVENLSLLSGVWQQEQAYISLNAESLNIEQQQFLDPVVKVLMNKEAAYIEDFSTEFQQGTINLNGEVAPFHAVLDRVSVNGLKWIPDNRKETDFLIDTLAKIEELKIKELDISHSQFIQLTGTKKWQVSGFNLEGRELSVIKAGKWGLWNGSLEMSANSASYEELLSNQPLISMLSEDGIWQLEEAFIPLEAGLINATGNYDLSAVSQPWRFEASVDGLPIEFITHWYSPPIQVGGIAEFQISATGLAGDELMLRHSLAASIVGTIREATITEENVTGDSRFNTRAVSVSEVSIESDRGRIKMQPVTFRGEGLNGNIDANIDLLNKESNQFSIHLQQKCQERVWDLLTNSQSLRISCSE